MNCIRKKNVIQFQNVVGVLVAVRLPSVVVIVVGVAVVKMLLLMHYVLHKDICHQQQIGIVID